MNEANKTLPKLLAAAKDADAQLKTAWPSCRG